MREILSILIEAKLAKATGMSNMVDLRKYFVSPARREMKATLNVIADTTTNSFSCAYTLMESPTTSSSDFVAVSQDSAFTAVTLASIPTYQHQERHFQTKADSIYLLGAAVVSGTVHVVSEAFIVKREA